MGLTDGTFLALLVGLAVGLLVGVVALWNRLPRPAILRWVMRVALLITMQVSVCAALVASVNDSQRFFTSWSALFGQQAHVSVSGPRAGGLDAGMLSRLHHRPRSIVTSVRVPVAGSTRMIPAEVYVPAAYFQHRYATRQFSVVELLDGFPGGPDSWLHPNLMNVQHVLDAEFAAGRAQPFIAVLPTQNFQGAHDGECIDAVHGTQVETTLVANVRRVVDSGFRVRSGPASWSVMGYSTGGYCALNIAMRHPDLFGSAVSLDGYTTPYVDSTTGPIFGRGAAYRDANSPLWRLRHGPIPRISVLLAYCTNDRPPLRDARTFARARRDPLEVSLLGTRGGGHNFATFRSQEPPAVDWIAQHILPPLAPSTVLDGHRPVDVGAPPSHERQ